jgi:hypothetical protein
MTKRSQQLRRQRRKRTERNKRTRVAKLVKKADNIKLVGVYQDGADFYHAGTGDRIVTYLQIVKGDYDMVGSSQARIMFARDFPHFVA